MENYTCKRGTYYTTLLISENYFVDVFRHSIHDHLYVLDIYFNNNLITKVIEKSEYLKSFNDIFLK